MINEVDDQEMLIAREEILNIHATTEIQQKGISIAEKTPKEDQEDKSKITLLLTMKYLGLRA